jgi:hypothetical protein
VSQRSRLIDLVYFLMCLKSGRVGAQPGALMSAILTRPARDRLRALPVERGHLGRSHVSDE